MEIQPLISFVIPAYNAEPTIEKCLKSITSLTNCEYEVIVVNDGSKDSTVEVCKSIENDKIRIISQENQGVSNARNKGIRECKGRFISFIDADDLICSQELEKVIEKIEFDDQLILFNMMRNANGILKRDKEPLESGLYGREGLDYLRERFLDLPVYKKWMNECLQGSACKFLFDREMLLNKNIFFNENLPYAEDLCFLLDVLNKFDKIRCLNYYVNIINPTVNSASRRYREFFWEELQRVYREIVRLTGEEHKNIYYYYGKGAIYHYISRCETVVARKKVKQIVNDEEFNKALKKINFNGKVLNERIDDFLMLHRAEKVLVCYKKLYFRIVKIGSYIKSYIKSNFTKR